MVLTVAGEAMVARGRQALDTLDLGMRDIAFLTDGGRGVVRVGADMAFIAGGLMADIMATVRGELSRNIRACLRNQHARFRD